MADLYFDPNYAKVYEDIDGKSDTFTFSCPYGKVQNTFILRPVKWQLDGKQWYDIVTPYGYGGPVILESNNPKKLMEAYREAFTAYCLEHNIVCEFIRFHLFDNVDVRENYYGETFHVLDNVVVDTTPDQETIWMSYEHKVRKNVKKAIGNGLTMCIEQNLDHLDAFLDIYYATMDRNQATDYYYFKRSYFEDIARLLPENFAYFHVMHEGKVISTELVLCSENYAYSFLGGTNEEFYAMRPNDFLKDAIIKWCNETGRKQFILGGGYHKDDGIYRYKRSFTKEPDVPFYIGRAILNQPVYDRLVELRAAEDPDFNKESSYFPLYRA